jgi:hypothetical protein
MFELGKRSEIFGAELLKPLSIGYGRPSQMPSLPQGHDVICGYDQGLGERMFVCESLEDMQQLYDSYARGYALYIYWYSGEDVGFVQVLGAGGT